LLATVTIPENIGLPNHNGLAGSITVGMMNKKYEVGVMIEQPSLESPW
jgi:hypothetical protein